MTSEEKQKMEEEILKEKVNEEASESAEQKTESEKAEDSKAETEKTEDSKAETEKTENSKAEAEKLEGTAEKKEDEDMKTQYMRLMADFQNFKRRTEKEKSDIYARANEKLAGDLLNVIDNFDRALSQGENSEDKSFVEGVSLVYKQFMDVLTKAGLEEIEALGLEFDPNFHNAVMTEDTDEYESGHVSAVLQKGYLLNKKVIRPSMVKVAN